MASGQLAIAVSFLLLAFAGCAGAAPKAADGFAKPPEFDETTGAITGFVIDDQYAPVVGALVGAAEHPDLQTTSDLQGRFSISRVPPGVYRLVAQRIGFHPTVREVTVAAGAATEVQFNLLPVEVPVPRKELKTFNGFISCSVAYARSVFTTNCPTTQATANFHEIYPTTQTWPNTFQGVLVEAEWKNGDDNLAFDFNDRTIGYYGVYYRTRDLSPLRFLLERCGDYRAQNFGRAPMPCTEEQVTASHMHLETFYAGRYQQQTHAGDPVCKENLTIPVYPLPGYQAGCYGVGAALELRWTNYVTILHVEVPKDLNTYSGRPER